MRAFLFTEAKRESQKDRPTAEAQIHGYCEGYLESNKREEVVFDGVAHGVVLRYFIVTKANSNRLVPLCNCVDIRKYAGCNRLRYLVRVIKA